MHRKRQTENRDRVGLDCGPARDARPGGPSAHHQRQAFEVLPAQLRDDLDPGGIELSRRWLRPSAGDSVGLLNQRDGQPRRPSRLRRRFEVWRPDATAGAVPEDQAADRLSDRVQVRTSGPSRCLDLDSRHGDSLMLTSVAKQWGLRRVAGLPLLG
jgi:hypothetical protein